MSPAARSPNADAVRRLPGLALVAALGLAGCSGKGGGGGAAEASGPHWNQADACQTVDKAAVAAATGLQVKDSSTTAPQNGAPAAVSMCTYTLSSGTLGVMTRVAKDDMTDAEIAQFNGGDGMMPKGEEVPGYGMKAWWSPASHQLQIVRDRRHYGAITYMAALTMPGAPAPAGPDPKTVALTLGKKLL